MFMFARAGIFQGAPERLDDEIIRRSREQMLQTLQGLPGFAGLHVLADRATGKTIAICLWEMEAALRAWERMRRPIVADHEATTGRAEQEGANYEVVFTSNSDRMLGEARLAAAH
jgi:heme-degrading monooxygenase HmoA